MSCLRNDGTSKDNLHFDEVVSLFSSQCFLKEKGNMFSLLLSSFSINLLTFYHN